MPNTVWQQLSTVQQIPTPSVKVLASAATIAPDTFITEVTGTVQVATITPPVEGYHMLAFRFSDVAPGALLTTGNIAIAYTPITDRPFLLFYDPRTAKYYPMAVS